MLCWCIYINLFIIAGQVSSSLRSSKSYGTLNSLLDILNQEQWDAEDKPCLHDTMEMLKGVENSTLWATWIWDSMQRPSGVLYGSRYQLGNYDQCLKPPWLNSHPRLHTQYCLADVHLTDVTPTRSTRTIDPYDNTEIYLNTASSYGRHLNVITWGVCMSSRCSAQTVSKLVQAMIRPHHLSGVGTKHIKVHSCQLAKDPAEYSFGFKASMWLLVVLVLVTILSNIYINNVKSDTLLIRLAKSFCLKRNWNSLMKPENDNLWSVDTIRLMNVFCVILIHYSNLTNIFFAGNGLELENVLKTRIGSMLLHVDMGIDTFFVMSGLLLVRGIVIHQKHGKGTLTRKLWLRYMRLIGPQAVMILYLACVSTYAGSGPLWPLINKSEGEDCANNWWANLLMINNYVNPSNMCYILSWYNSCDFQLMVLGTMLYLLYQKNKRVGLQWFTITFLLSILLPGLVTYRDRLPAIFASDLESFRNVKTNPVFISTYIQSHHRAGSYLIGMVLGHFIAIYDPADYKRIIPKKWAFSGALLSLVLVERVLSTGSAKVLGDYDALNIAMYVSVNRHIWALAICCLIVCCEYSIISVLNESLNLQFTVVMRRLSYGVFMVHLALIYRLSYSIRSPTNFDATQTIVGGFGVFICSYLLSCIMWHLIEAPLVNITNVLLDSISQKKTTQGKIVNGLENKTDKVQLSNKKE